jgi:hypothetical protein
MAKIDKYVIDTHTLVWFLTNSKLLGPEAKKRLKDPKSEFYVLTNVLEEIRRKFEKFKADNKEKGAIKIPPIVCWRILEKSKNVRIRRLADKESGGPVSKDLLKKFKKDDQPFVQKYFILKKKYPRSEVEVITKDDILRKSDIIRTCW